MDLRPYQKTGISFLVARAFALLGDTMGLGKTAQYLRAAWEVAQGGRVLILAPEGTIPGLLKQIALWLTGVAPVVLDRRGNVPAPAAGWIILGWTSAAARLADILAGPRLDVLIFDECHRVKNPGAKVTKAVLGKWVKNESGQWTRTPCLAAHAKRIWAATGTPIPNRPIELQPLLHLGFGQRWAGYTVYGDRYCRQRNKFVPRGYDYMGAHNLPELNAKIREAGILLRRTPADLPGELPELGHTTVPLAVGEPAIDGLDAGALAGITAGADTVPFELLSKYRREMGTKKTDKVFDWVKNWMEDNEDEALVIFCWHKDVVEALAAKLGEDAIYAHGEMSPEERQNRVEAFAAGQGRVFVGTIGACGLGLNGLHLRTSYCAFAEMVWVPGELEQAIGRVRRLGGKGSHCHAYLLVGQDSLEAHIMETMLDKIEVAATVLADTAAPAPEAPCAAPEAPAPAPGAPAPAPEAPCATPEAPTEAEQAAAEAPKTGWTWASLRSGDWGVRFAAPGSPAWEGAVVEVRNRAGVKKQVALARRMANGSDWSLWQTGQLPVEVVVHNRLSFFLHRKGQTESLPLVNGEREAAAAASEACRALEGLDGDRGMQRNDQGWSASTRFWGMQLARIPAAMWDKRFLSLARQVLNVHRKNQVSEDLAKAIWG